MALDRRGMRCADGVRTFDWGPGVLLSWQAMGKAEMFAGKPQNPGAKLKHIFLSANAGKYSEANDGLARPIRTVIEEQGVMKMLWDSISRNGTIATVEILKVTTRGEGATVEYKIHYKDGKTLPWHDDMLQEGGEWRISSPSFMAIWPATRDLNARNNEDNPAAPKDE
jgi:hypothetical protein